MISMYTHQQQSAWLLRKPPLPCHRGGGTIWLGGGVGVPAHIYIYIYLCTHRHIHRHINRCIYICIYIYIYMFINQLYILPPQPSSKDQRQAMEDPFDCSVVTLDLAGLDCECRERPATATGMSRSIYLNMFLYFLYLHLYPCKPMFIPAGHSVWLALPGGAGHTKKNQTQTNQTRIQKLSNIAYKHGSWLYKKISYLRNR